MTAKTVVKVLALCAAVMLFAGMAAFAQEGNTSGTIVAGGEVVTGDTDSSRFEQYEEWPEGVMVFGASFDWFSKSGYYMTFEGSDFGYDDNAYFMEWGKKGTFKLALTWDENPRWFSNKARSFWNQRTTTEYNWLNGEVAPVDLRYVRQTGGAFFNYSGIENWDFNVSYTHETRDGHQPMMTELATSPTMYAEIASPVDYRTQNFNGNATWSNGKWFAGGSYNYNRFDNAYSYMTILYPNPATFSVNQMLAPDSKAYNFSLFGGVNLPYHHRITATIDWGEISSDTAFLPNAYGLTSLDGQVDTFLANLRISGEPIRWFGYSVHYRAQDLDDQTPTYLVGTGTGVRGSRIAGYTKDEWGAEIHFDPIEHVRFGIEYTDQDTDHQYREFHSTSEQIWKGTLDLNWAPWVSFRASYSDIKHTDGALNHELEEELYPPPATPPTTYGGTFFDIERRDSTIFNALVIWTPLPNLAINASTMSSEDEYPHAYFGLQNYEYDNWGIGVDYAWTDRLTLYANYLDEGYNSDMWAMYIYRQQPIPSPLNEWGHAYDDSVDTYTIGFNFDAVPERFDFSSDYAYSKGKSASMFTFVPGGTNGDTGTVGNGIYNGNFYGAYPLVWNKYSKWENRFNYHFNKNLSASFAYIWQEYEGEDWATDDMAPLNVAPDYNITGLRLLGAVVPDYDADIFQFYISFTF